MDGQTNQNLYNRFQLFRKASENVCEKIQQIEQKNTSITDSNNQLLQDITSIKNTQSDHNKMISKLTDNFDTLQADINELTRHTNTDYMTKEELKQILEDYSKTEIETCLMDIIDTITNLSMDLKTMQSRFQSITPRYTSAIDLKTKYQECVPKIDMNKMRKPNEQRPQQISNNAADIAPVKIKPIDGLIVVKKV